MFIHLDGCCDRKEFTAFASQSLNKLSRNMAQTAKSLQTNKWLAGAKVIYDAVRSKRTAQGFETKSFMDWVGIKQHQMDTIVTGPLTYYIT